MKISDLQKHLAALKRKHGDLVVICSRYSDFQRIEVEEVTVKEGVERDDKLWIERSHSTMPADAKKEKFLHFDGN